ncbi:zinc finger protein, putative [Bodo saltans]|uniref:Zinc finger protein, putative n=1 Tax=Bodo saltans TaxID=75058 RepID=A0A0S4JLL7_BODSA|nr:zinc finger protein, putative [Bodo saltans]|eukprot:CUG89998.1 zinc finger protein, putative [Bodo saltans]
MGAVCCCCRDARDSDVERNSSRPRQARPQQAMNTTTHAPPPQPEKTRCDICSRVVDPCLLDGHRESCRAHHRKKMQEQQVAKPSPTLQPSSSPTNDDDIPAEFLCIVCMESRKEYAFVPCGHVVGCHGCVSKLDSCPVCRTPRRGILKLDMEDSTRCLCKHCGHVITPAYYDGHREVCTLQMKQLERERAAAGDTSSAPSVRPVVAESEMKLCVNCKQADRDTALLPCCHRVLCGPCALSAPSCPVCFTAVSSVVTTYDA